jgi:hypothetical protein
MLLCLQARAKSLSMSRSQVADVEASKAEAEEEAKRIVRLRKPCWIIVGVGFFLAMFVWPLLTLPAGIFSESYFTFYVVMTFIFVFLGSIIGIFFPIWEARTVIMAVFKRKPTAVIKGEAVQDVSTRGAPNSPSKEFANDPKLQTPALDDSVRGTVKAQPKV